MISSQLAVRILAVLAFLALCAGTLEAGAFLGIAALLTWATAPTAPATDAWQRNHGRRHRR